MRLVLFFFSFFEKEIVIVSRQFMRNICYVSFEILFVKSILFLDS